MEINPVIHHHFVFSSAILQNTEYCKRITFKSIPFFKLYEMKDLPQVRNIIDTLSTIPMPHRYQKIIRELRPPKHLEDADYRVDVIPMIYCVHNRQSFFVRAYRLRGNDFFKIEIILHSDTLGARDNYTFEKAFKGAQSFFKQIDSSVLETVPFSKHLSEYFFVEDFRKEVQALQKDLNTIRDCTHSTTKKRLMKEVKRKLLEFKENAKERASERLQFLKGIKNTKVALLQLIKFAETC